MTPYRMNQLPALLRAYAAADIPAFIWGPPGIGKSDGVAQLAAADNVPMVDMRLAQIDPVDLRGLPAEKDGRIVFLPCGSLPIESRDGARGYLFLDEMNQAPDSVMRAAYQLIRDRRVGDYVFPAGWRIFAAGNRQSDKSSAQRMPAALADRFGHIEIVADLESFCQFANIAGLDATVVAFLRFRPALLHTLDKATDLRVFATPRSWHRVSDILPHANDSIRQGLVAGLVGDGPAVEFEGFLRLFRALPSIDSIIADPSKAPIPQEPGILYAVATAVARHATRANFAKDR